MNVVKDPKVTRQDLHNPQFFRPVIYSRFSKVRSQALDEHEDTPPYDTEVKNPNLIRADPRAGRNHRTSTQDLELRAYDRPLCKNDIDRRHLVQEVGGFHQRSLLSTFYQGFNQRREHRKTLPTQISGPDEEFLKVQKKKLKDLMIKNSEEENRKLMR